MVTRFAMATVAVLLGSGSAYAQARMNVSPLPALGITSPLGIPNAPVGNHLARLRIDGIDSPIIDRTATPPTFLNQRIEIT